MTSPAFLARSRCVSDRFLQSAVVVDDLARLGDEPRPTPLKAPGRGGRSATLASAPASTDERYNATHDLNAKPLVDTFAELGIVCAVLRPKLVPSGMGDTAEDMEAVRIRTDHATQRSDIVILDWNIPPEPTPGDNAKDLIRNILATDMPKDEDHERSRVKSQRLRLIAVYTGEPGLKAIADQLLAVAEEIGLPEPTRDEYTVRAGPVTFVVYGKEHGTVSIQEDKDQRVDEKSLPERLLHDFSLMTVGLLSNVALASLSAVRDNTHRILSRFGPRLDPPYIAHRAMMEPPEEAAEHPVPLVAAEIEGVLADSPDIPPLIAESALAEWLDGLDGIRPGRTLEMDVSTFKTQLLDLLTTGLSRHNSDEPMWKDLVDRLRNYRDREATSILSNELTDDETRGSESDLEFAVLTSVRSQYDAPQPFLRLGTVVAIERNERTDYRLCIQPLCDSVRVKDKRVYPFLRLKERTADSEHPFEIVVEDYDGYKRLDVSLRAFEMEMISMKPDKERRVVLASRREGSWVFEAAGRNPPLVRWVADLKTDFAFRIANRFAAAVSRVGLTESEWLRRMAFRYPEQVVETLPCADEDGEEGSVHKTPPE